MNELSTNPKPSALGVMAARLSVEPAKLLETLKATVFKNASNEELLALVVVANEYSLSPFLKEIYAFPAKGGGIVPVVSIDGWTKIVNRQETYDGVEFKWSWNESDLKPISCTCSMHIRGRSRPVEVTEFYSECFRQTDPWKNMPARMLRHRAFIQAARIAFGLSGIMEEDEAATIVEVSPPPFIPLTIAPAKKAEAPPLAQQPSPGIAAAKAIEPTPQQELADFVEAQGFSFDTFKNWCKDSGNVSDIDSIPDFSGVPSADAKRILRAKTGFKAGLERCTPRKEASVLAS